MWWDTPVIPALRSLRQNCWVCGSLGYKVSPSQSGLHCETLSKIQNEKLARVPWLRLWAWDFLSCLAHAEQESVFRAHTPQGHRPRVAPGVSRGGWRLVSRARVVTVAVHDVARWGWGGTRAMCLRCWRKTRNPHLKEIHSSAAQCSYIKYCAVKNLYYQTFIYEKTNLAF